MGLRESLWSFPETQYPKSKANCGWGAYIYQSDVFKIQQNLAGAVTRTITNEKAFQGSDTYMGQHETIIPTSRPLGDLSIS